MFGWQIIYIDTRRGLVGMFNKVAMNVSNKVAMNVSIYPNSFVLSTWKKSIHL